MHRGQCRRVMGSFRRVVILISPPLFFMTSLRRRVSVPDARGRLSATRGIGSRPGRWLSIWGRGATMVRVVQVSPSLTIRGVLMRHLVIFIGIYHTFEASGWTVISIPSCGFFGSSEGRDWWRCTSSDPSGLSRVRMMLIWLTGVVGPPGWRPVFGDWPNLRRRAVTTTVRRNRPMCAMVARPNIRIDSVRPRLALGSLRGRWWRRLG